MKKIIIMELILAFSIFYLIKYVPNYENTILVLKDDIKIEREEPLERSEEDLFLLKKNTYVKEIFKDKNFLQNIFIWNFNRKWRMWTTHD